MPDDAQNILSPLQVDNSIKANAWEAFNSAKNENELGVRLQGMNLPQDAKARLWEAKKKAAPLPIPDATAQAQQAIKNLPAGFPTTFGDRLRNAQNPGSFEGKPENVGEYIPQSVGQMAAGGKDIMQGKFARGGSEMIRGAGNALLPAAPFAIAAAPAAAATGMAGGVAGGYIGKTGAAFLGANPEQAQFAGDVGSLIGGYGGAKVPGAFGKAVAALPSRTRAGQAMNEVQDVVGQHTVDFSEPGNVALRARDLSQTGGRMPKVMSDFLKRVTDPKQPPLTYEEGRDFYSNATKLSSGEYSNLSGPMKAQVAQFTQKLGSALNEVAARADRGQQLQAAMTEYSRAAAIKEAGQTAKDIALQKILPGGAIGAGLTGGAYLAKKLLPKAKK